MSKRKHDSLAEPTFQSLPLTAVYDFLEPLDLVACLGASKASRSVAGRKLNTYQYDVQTLSQRLMFERWLVRPTVSQPRGFMPGGMMERGSENSLAGPLRLGAIRQMASELKRCFIILSYQRTYEKESALVAICDSQGALVAIYEYSSDMFYDHVSLYDGMFSFHTGHACRDYGYNRANIVIINSGIFSDHSSPFALFDQGLNWGSPENFDYLTANNYKLVSLFQGRLSPTEAVSVLMHSLSSDTRSIYAYIELVYDRFFTQDEEHLYDDHHDEEERQAYLDWRAEMKDVVYPPV